MAQRYVTPGGWMSQAIHIGISVCAGVANANSMRNIMLFVVLEDFTNRYCLQSTPSQWVDGLAIPSWGTERQLQRIMPRSLLDLRSPLSSAGLAFSIKSVMLAASANMPKHITERLAT